MWEKKNGIRIEKKMFHISSGEENLENSNANITRIQYCGPAARKVGSTCQSQWTALGNSFFNCKIRG